MKPILFIAALLVTSFSMTRSCSQTTTPGGPVVFGVFVASTPCSEGTRPLPGIPVNAGCEFIKWNLVLYQDSLTQAPTTYQLHCVYGLPKQGTNGFEGGGTRLEMKGKWIITKGIKTDPEAVVYQLQTNDAQLPVRFLKLNDHLLHLLDREKRLMIGSPAWSYTLNRTKP